MVSALFVAVGLFISETRSVVDSSVVVVVVVREEVREAVVVVLIDLGLMVVVFRLRTEPKVGLLK